VKISTHLPTIVAIIVTLGGCVNSSAQQPQVPKIVTFVNDLKSKTVALVDTNHDSDVRPYCTGVWVANDKIVTAEHCTASAVERMIIKSASGLETDEEIEEQVQREEDGFKVEFITNEETTGSFRNPLRKHAAIVVKHDHMHDIALLKVNDTTNVPQHTYARVPEQLTHVGENVHVVGHVVGMYWTYTRCTLAAYREERFKPVEKFKLGPFMQIAGEVYMGNSGGGGFNDAGELIGLASFLTPAPNETFFVHTSTIKSFIK
jgi:hypothetical protein